MSWADDLLNLFQPKFFTKHVIYCGIWHSYRIINIQTTTSGSLSCSDTSTSTWCSNKDVSLSRYTSLKNPLSELECSHKTTDVPECTASRASWCDSSPVIHKSALWFRKRLPPDPAQTAIVSIIFSSNEKKQFINSLT